MEPARQRKARLAEFVEIMRTLGDQLLRRARAEGFAAVIERRCVRA